MYTLAKLKIRDQILLENYNNSELNNIKNNINDSLYDNFISKQTDNYNTKRNDVIDTYIKENSNKSIVKKYIKEHNKIKKVLKLCKEYITKLEDKISVLENEEVQIEYNKESINFANEDEAYEYFCKMQGYSGPRILDPPINDFQGNIITDWRRIALECVYAPTSKVHDTTMKNDSMVKGDLIVNTNDSDSDSDSCNSEAAHYSNIKLFDGNDIVDLDDNVSVFGGLPLWTIDTPNTYYSVPSKLTNQVGFHYSLHVNVPVAKTKKDTKEWLSAIKALQQNKNADYCIFKNKYVIIDYYSSYIYKETGDYYYLDSNFKKSYQSYNYISKIKNDHLYLHHEDYFKNIIREDLPPHGIIHESFLSASTIEKMIRRETGIPLHHFYHL